MSKPTLRHGWMQSTQPYSLLTIVESLTWPLTPIFGFKLITTSYSVGFFDVLEFLPTGFTQQDFVLHHQIYDDPLTQIALKIAAHLI
jgi:hypothetical protein